MSNFNPMGLIGPCFVDVMQMGDKVLEGTNFVADNGHFMSVVAKIYNREIGKISGLPFDNTVKDCLGKKIGVLETGPNSLKSLRRW